LINLPHANKVLLKVAHAFLYTLMDFFRVAPNCLNLLSYFIPTRSIALVKRLVHQRAEIDPPATLTKVLLQGSTHSYIHGWTSFSRTKLCPNRCYLTFFHIPDVQIALVDDWLVHKRAVDPNLPHANKVLLQGSTRVLIH
jgi:hypothetical protein